MIVSDETGRLVAVCCHEGVASLEAEAEANARAIAAVHDLLDDLDEVEAERDKLRLLVQERGHEEYCLMGAGPCWVCNAIKETP